MKPLITSVKIFIFLTLMTGVVYPFFITAVSEFLFPFKAGGSIIYKADKPVGSRLIGQNFDTAIYFSARPSYNNYNPLPSGGSNLGLTNSKLKGSALFNKKHFVSFNHLDSLINVPSEMVFESGSGLDPEISVRGALLQVDRIASARHFSNLQKQSLIDLVNKEVIHPDLGFLGEERVNVLLLNLDLDKLK